MAVPDRGPGWDMQLARALYAYLSSGDNQLSFLEGDIIALMGEFKFMTFLVLSSFNLS